MAESNITKRALAQAMKELIEEIPFEKINVGQICERCNMNRKSFYYHFRDKYDLVNWIFDTEFIAVASQKDFRTGWEFFSELCGYLYQNRSFYLRALKIKGQNSFSDPRNDGACRCRASVWNAHRGKTGSIFCGVSHRCRGMRYRALDSEGALCGAGGVSGSAEGVRPTGGGKGISGDG